MQIAQILNLPIQQKISDYCSIRHIDELATLVIDHPIGFAAITLQGAHLLTWQPQNQNHPIIWLSPKSAFKKNAPIRVYRSAGHGFVININLPLIMVLLAFRLGNWLIIKKIKMILLSLFR